jgi:hypothetical protein
MGSVDDVEAHGGASLPARAAIGDIACGEHALCRRLPAAVCCWENAM